MQNLNWLDILFAILLVYMIYKGVRVGVGGQILSLFGWFALLFTSLTFYRTLSDTIFSFLLYRWARPLSFFIICFIIFIMIKLVEKLAKVISGDELAIIEKIGGACMAAVRAFLLFGILGILLLLIPLDFTRSAVLEKSKSAMFFVKLDAQIYSFMTGSMGLAQKRAQEKIIDELLEEPREG